MRYGFQIAVQCGNGSSGRRAEHTSSIEDEDGLNEAESGYQWIAEGSDIDEATGSSYAFAEDEKGLTVKVRVSFTGAAGNGESLTSEATPALELRPNSPATGQPTIICRSSGDGQGNWHRCITRRETWPVLSLTQVETTCHATNYTQNLGGL